MKRSYKIIRLIVVSLLSLTVGIPLLLYLLLWLGPVRERLRLTAETELSSLLGAQVKIEKLWIEPFARVGLSKAAVIDSVCGDTILSVDHIGCGVSVTQLLLSRRLVITDAELFAPELHIYRATPDSPLNVQPILDRLKSPDQEKKPMTLRLAVNTVVLRRGAVTYDVLSADEAPEGLFNPNHIHISDLTADISAPSISADEVTLSLKRLALREQCGVRIHDFHARVAMTDSLLCIDDFSTRFNSSNIAIGPLRVPYPSPDQLIPAMLASPTELEICRGTEIYLSDLSHFVAGMPAVAQPVRVDALLSGVPDSIHVKRLKVDVPLVDSHLEAEGTILNLFNADEIALRQGSVKAEISAPALLPVVGILRPAIALKVAPLAQCGLIQLQVDADGSPSAFTADASLSSDAGSVDLSGEGAISGSNVALSGQVDATDLMLSLVAPQSGLGSATFSAGFDGSLEGKRHSSLTADLDVAYVEFRGYAYSNIGATVEMTDMRGSASLSIDDPEVAVTADASLLDVDSDGTLRLLLDTDISHINPAALRLWDKYPGRTFAGHLAADLTGSSLATADGSVRLDRLNFHNDSTGVDIHVDPIALTMHNSSAPQSLEFSSSLLTAWVEGEYTLPQVQHTALQLAAAALNLKQPAEAAPAERPATLRAKVQIMENEELADFLRLPVRPLYPITLDASLSSADTTAAVTLRAPYLRKGDKLIRGTRLEATLGAQGASILAQTLLETNRGDLSVNVASDVDHGNGDLRLDWGIDNPRQRSEGALALNFDVDPERRTAFVNIRPTEMLFNDSTWHIRPAALYLSPELITVSNLRVDRRGQSLVIDGSVSADTTATLEVALKDVDLDYLFETLNIGDAVMFGGTAGGTVHASALLSKSPVITTDNLHVAGLSYGHCVMGDGNIRAAWLPESQGIALDARIDQKNGLQSRIYGAIYPTTEVLDLNFDANHAQMGFLMTFMNAFASEVSGEASGKAHLFGTFKLVDMTGDLMAHDFTVRLAFTNVAYHATDSVHLRSGIVDINNLTIRDAYGHTATLNGALRHSHFKRPEFDFRVTDAKDLLVYDQPAKEGERWYGRIFGNGTAYVKGVPGHVDIGANVATTGNSEFTFVLTDALQAGEYSFLTLHDASVHSPVAIDSLNPGTPQLDRVMFDKVRSLAQQEVASSYAMDINVDINPQAKITLVMDPVGGDKITAYGNGHANLLYSTANDDLRMFGNYNITRGDYLFTLQDIIIKKFTIAEGSTIAFHGNPYDAQLDISALYALNANLLDLDQSFQTDKEVARTNVPVNAVLNVAGSMQQPDISFDLKFPTLTADVDRKVRSIISTDEMMNRQIIYLLALNKFYTPDYMASAAKGSELMSVASSTISSQLSNILGQLSNKFTVAPSLRSDASNLSDMEFDIALSSTLLNNRLLLNGNLGYRDSQLNNNQFIGDFDIEYLLTRGGNWRLKAYNHFNDRNLYTRSALTTQGIGIMFKHDFNNPFRSRKNN